MAHFLTKCTDDTLVFGRPNLDEKLYSLLLVSVRRRKDTQLETSAYYRGSNGL
jgi:hypothetical protein